MVQLYHIYLKKNHLNQVILLKYIDDAYNDSHVNNTDDGVFDEVFFESFRV